MFASQLSDLNHENLFPLDVFRMVLNWKLFINLWDLIMVKTKDSFKVNVSCSLGQLGFLFNHAYLQVPAPFHCSNWSDDYKSCFFFLWAEMSWSLCVRIEPSIKTLKANQAISAVQVRVIIIETAFDNLDVNVVYVWCRNFIKRYNMNMLKIKQMLIEVKMDF